jgi:hypothetical protein
MVPIGPSSRRAKQFFGFSFTTEGPHHDVWIDEVTFYVGAPPPLKVEAALTIGS